jgi:hypothetical protein
MENDNESERLTMNDDWQNKKLGLNSWYVLVLSGAGILAPFILPPKIWSLVLGWGFCLIAIVIGVWLLVQRKCRDDRSLVIIGMALSGLWLMFTVLLPLWNHLLNQRK